MEKANIEILWKDRKRILGMPISFTKYKLSSDRLFVEKGLFNSEFDEILLYRVTDLTIKKSFGQKIFGVGSVIVNSSDKTLPILELKNIKNAFDVKELIHTKVEKAKRDRKMRVEEMVSTGESDVYEEE